MNKDFAKMMDSYRERTGTTAEDLTGTTKMQKARIFMIEKGLVPLLEEDARLFLKTFNFTKEEQLVVQGSIVEKREKTSTRTRFGTFMQLYRMKNNMILGEMARMVQASTAYASGVEHGKYPLTNEYVEKILETLTLTTQESKALKKYLK